MHLPTTLPSTLPPRRHAVALALLLPLATLACGSDTPAAAQRLAVADGAPATLPPPGATPVATFSIVAYDPDTGDLGVAVQSKFFGVGAVVPWARAGVGAVATQSYANTTYGPRGLELLESGIPPRAVVEELTGTDAQREQRQVGIVDAGGRAATFTGDACLAWAGGHTGEHYAVQGNILAGPAVTDAMAIAFETTAGDLATRLVTALAAGQAAGGDARGRQSAALLVVRDKGGYSGFNDRYIDLRVDDHAAPIRELRRLLQLRHGQIAVGNVGRLLRDGDPTAALAVAEEAARLLPDDGTAWMALAAARLAGDDREGAAAAGREALVREPWLRTALVQGRLDTDLLERLLSIESFARFWEALPARDLR